jgi:predicted amidohydrolase YtcJ
VTPKRTLFTNVADPYGGADPINVVVADGKIESIDTPSGGPTDLGNVFEEVVDAHGNSVLPAFGDGHAHPQFGGIEDEYAPVRGHATVAAIVESVRLYALAHPDEPWLQGWGYDPSVVPGGVFQAAWLDDAVADRPVVLRGTDYHTVWCNSAALTASGIDASTPDPPNGAIVRDGGGNPVGTLREWGATRLVLDRLPALSRERRVGALDRATRKLLSAGITWVQDAWVEPDDVATYLAALHAGALHIRVNLALRAEPGQWRPQVDEFLALAATVTATRSEGWLTANTVKFFADGVIEGGTAAMLTAYSDCPCSHGIANWSAGDLAAAVTAFDAAGFQTHIHAIGDAGIRMALDAIEAAQRTNGDRDRRPVITHVQVVDPTDRTRFAALRIIANFEPLWAQLDPLQRVLTMPRLGDRADLQYPMRTLLRSGAPISFGSDWPVTDYHPLPGIATAVTRQTPDGTPDGGWLAHERLTLAEAVAAYTSGSAFQAFRDDVGFAAGRVADLVLLDVDVNRVAPLRLHDATVVGTWIAGERVLTGT